MLRTLIALLPWRATLFMMLGAGAAMAYFSGFAGAPSALPAERMRQADTVARQMITELPTPDVPMRLVVLPLRGDPTQSLREALTETIRESGKFQTVRASAVTETLRDLGVGLPAIGTIEDARRAARWLPGERFLYGSVERWPLRPGPEEGLVVTLTLLNETGGRIWQSRFDSSRLLAGAPRWRQEIMPWVAVFGASFAVCMLLPLLILPWVRARLSERTNRESAVLVGVLALADVLISFSVGCFWWGWRQSIGVAGVTCALSILVWSVYLPLIARR